MYECYSFKKGKKTGVIITALVCIFIVSVTAVLVYKALFTPLPAKEEVVPQGEPVAATPLSDEIKYGKHTQYFLTEVYLCGHKKQVETTIPDEFIGKTIEEIKAQYPHIQINAYNDFSISSLKVTNEICDNHYIITLSGDNLISYKKSEPEKIIKKSAINLNEFLKEDTEILKGGIEVGSRDEMLEFFEDFAN